MTVGRDLNTIRSNGPYGPYGSFGSFYQQDESHYRPVSSRSSTKCSLSVSELSSPRSMPTAEAEPIVVTTPNSTRSPRTPSLLLAHNEDVNVYEVSRPDDLAIYFCCFNLITNIWNRHSKLLPLRSLDDQIHYVSFSIQIPSLQQCLFPFFSCCLVLYSATETKLRMIELTGSSLLTQLCSESGPCITLVTSQGVLNFQTANKGDYSYGFWERELRFRGVKIVKAGSLFLQPPMGLAGEGSFGKVYHSIYRTTGEAVVIKRVPKFKLNNLAEDYSSAVHIEIEILSSVKHPCIVQYYAAYEDDSYYYLILESLTGGNLFQYIRGNGVLTEEQAKIIMAKLLSALCAMSSVGVVHRDLKLENLMLTNPNDPTSIKIIDFGLSAYLGSPRMRMNCGSPGFVAPEVTGKMPYGQIVDLFSAGVMLYSMLSGSAPFHHDGDTASQTLAKNVMCVVKFDAPIWTKVSHNARDFILGLMAKEPECRLPLNEALNHPWLTDVPKYPRTLVASPPALPRLLESLLW